MECRLNSLRGKSIALMTDIVSPSQFSFISPNCTEKRPTRSPVQALSPFVAPNFPKPDTWYLNFMEKCICVKPNFLQEPETGKTKLKIGGNIHGICDLGEGRCGSEAIFVPCELGISSEEDDGYLRFFVRDENIGLILCKQTDAATLAWLDKQDLLWRPKPKQNRANPIF